MPGLIEIIGRTEEGGAPIIQGRSDEVSKGFSGAPVWDLGTRLVAGMITSILVEGADPAGKQRWGCYLRPVEVLRAVEPALVLLDASPYRGLGVFREEHADTYFGRDRAVAELLELVAIEPFVALIGVSGAGKSSLIRAGLERGLRQGGYPGIARRRRVILQPGSDPVLALVAAFGLHMENANLTPTTLTDIRSARRGSATGRPS